MNSNFKFPIDGNCNSLFQVQEVHESSGVTRQMNIIENKIDWKKSMSDRLVRRMMKQREDRIDQVRMNKEEILNDLRYEEMVIDSMDQDTAILSEYFDKILLLFENDLINPGEYAMEVHRNSNISVCPFCSYPVILTARRIMCLNLCFEYSIPPNTINDNFTLDNFVDVMAGTYKTHYYCLATSKEGIQILAFEDEIQIVCGKCFKENIVNN